MTSVIAVVDKNASYIVADTLGFGSTHSTIGQDKIFRRDALMFGVSGSYAAINCLKYHLKLPKRVASDSSAQYIHKHLYTAIKECFTEASLLTVVEGDLHIEALVLIVYDQKIYIIQEDFSILEPKEDFYAIGSGAAYTLAAYKAIDLYNTQLSIKEKAQEALRITSIFCPEVNAQSTSLMQGHTKLTPEIFGASKPKSLKLIKK